LTSLVERFFAHYSCHKRSLSNISMDSVANVPLCASPLEFLCYDQVVRLLYSGENSLSSPDMVHLKGESLIFVEFKNGTSKLSADDKRAIRIKAIEGAFIVLLKAIRTFEPTATFDDVMRIPKEYYVVYNSQSGRGGIDRISQHLQHASLRYGLDPYKGTFFVNVMTMSEKVFERSILPTLCS